MDGPDVVSLITGASVLLTNDYELELLQSKTGWTKDKVQQTVGYRVTTLGSKGVEIESADGSLLTVAALPEKSKVDPTGVGDAFRAGFLAGNEYGLPLERSAQLGSLMATLTLETVGTQEYHLDADTARVRLADAYGEDAAADIAHAVGW
jgi:adenosine kinase